LEPVPFNLRLTITAADDIEMERGCLRRPA
jgi:hypothetical protein